MDEEAVINRLWEAFPPLVLTPIMNHGVKSGMVGDEILRDYLQRLARYFYRGGTRAGSGASSEVGRQTASEPDDQEAH